jgi:6-phosphogluconate dehydrogenase (decarboxylating)
VITPAVTSWFWVSPDDQMKPFGIQSIGVSDLEFARSLGRWTIQAAIEEAFSAEVLTAALFARFRSRREHTFAEKMLSAMRNKFGGHVESYPGN